MKENGNDVRLLNSILSLLVCIGWPAYLNKLEWGYQGDGKINRITYSKSMQNLANSLRSVIQMPCTISSGLNVKVLQCFSDPIGLVLCPLGSRWLAGAVSSSRRILVGQLHHSLPLPYHLTFQPSIKTRLFQGVPSCRWAIQFH